MQTLTVLKAELLLLAVAIIWGTSYGLTKEALMYVSVPLFMLLRFGLTFILLSPYLFYDLKQGHLTDLLAAASTGLILLAIFLAEIYGVAHTSAAHAAFLISLCVLLTPLLEWLFFKRIPSLLTFSLAVLSLAGVYLLTLTMQTGFNLQLNLGDGLILIAAFLRALMGIVTKKLMQNRRLSALGLTAVQTGVVGLGACLLLFVTQTRPIELPSNGQFWLTLSYLVLFCTIFAFFALNYALKHTTPTRVALLTGSEPAFGALFAVFYLGEHLAWYQWLGGCLIVFASLMLLKPNKA